MRSWMALVFLLGCGGDDRTDASDSSRSDTAMEDVVADVATDSRADGVDDAGESTVAVQHQRELRGVWIATVSNIGWPSRAGLSREVQRNELEQMLDDAAAAGLNAVFFQVRAEADAFYASELEPWSRFLSGTQGEDPGYDPLSFAIEQAHARGLELHAWMNPYRAKSSASSVAADSHPSVTLADYARPYGSLVWLDPGASEVRAQTMAVVRDVLTRYPIDGLHFDDYFYPYPTAEAFPDDATYEAYQDGGGELSLGDWRRSNVNQLVEQVALAVNELAPHVRFGISPFGIYRPGMPEGIRGLDQYEAIYADPVLWIEQGWVDYLAPQLYWPTTRTAQAYEPLAAWWADLAHDGHLIFIGNYLSQYETSEEWTLEEFAAQVRITRELSGEGLAGNIFFRMKALQDHEELANAFADDFYPTPAASPVIASALDASLAPPSVSRMGDGAIVGHADELRYLGVYAEDGDGWRLDRLLPGTTVDVRLSEGRWAISAIDRRGVESPGVVLEI